MAVTDQQKLDFLLKKIGYTKTKTGSVVGTGAISGTPKQPFAEAIPSPLVVPNASLWNEADSIPATAPGADTTQVKVYLAGTSGLRMTADSTSSGQRAYIAYTTYNNTSSARLTNWIDTQFGSSYLIKVYKGDPNSGGVALSAAGSGSNDGWFFDYSAGVLNFNDTSVPSGVTDTNIYIVGYRYVGQTGAPTSGISTFSYLDLTVERNLDVGVQGGISTFRNNIDANGIIEGIAGENKIPFLYSNLAALPNAGTYHGMFAHVHSEGRGYFAHAGNWLELVNKDTSGNVGLSGDLDVDGHTNLDNVSVAGVSTFTGNATFSGNVSIGGTLTYEDVINVDSVGIITARAGINVTGGVITALAGENKIPSLYANMGALPSAGSYHGMFAHVHSTGRGYFAHAGNWLELVNADTTGRVGTGTESYFIDRLVSTSTTATSLNITGVTTAVTVDINGDLDVDGHTNLDNVSISGVVTATTFVGNGDFVELDVDGHTNLDNLSVAGVSTFAGTVNTASIVATGIDLNGDIDVDGHTNLDNVSIAGVSTFAGTVNTASIVATGIDLNGDIDVDGHTNLDNVSIAGVSTFANAIDLNADLDVDGHTNLDNVSIAGVTTATGNIIANGSIDLAGDIDVDGHTNLDNVSVAGVTTFTGTAEFDGTAKFDSTITAGGATGSNGQYLKTTGTGVAWASFPTLRTRQTSTASSGQTTFSFSYTVNFLDVFVNGIKLTDAEFTATNGSSVVLAVGCFVGDIVELVGYNTVSGGGGGGGGSLNNIVEDTTPQLGGNLDLFNKTITGTGGINMTGVVTATSFIGNGSGLTGVVASGTGVVIKNSGSTVGTAGTINFGDNLSVSPASAGIVTITGSAGVSTSQFDVNKLDVSGISTFSGNIDVNADLDVDGHTNLDNVSISGVTTFSEDVKFDGATAGRDITFDRSDNRLKFANSTKASFGNTDQMEVYHSGSHGYITNTGGRIDVSGDVKLNNDLDIIGDLDVDGHTELDNVNIAGVVTATTFKGAVQATSGTFSSGVDITGDLDVDGHTDLDNVSVAGVVTATTFVGALTGNVTGNTSGSSGSCTGNAATATALQNARTIGGVSFDGTANINLPGVNASGNQDTSGTAAVATNVTVSANNTTNETVYPVFVDGATGSQGAETDTGLTYNPSTGNLTSTKFTGDGSGLTGITASGSGVVIKHDGSTVGTAGTINFSTNLDVSAISAGIVTITASGGGFSPDAQGNLVSGTNAGDSFSGTDANNNVLLGLDAGTAITTADGCVFIGENAGEVNTTRGSLVSIGANSGTKVDNAYGFTAVGDQAGKNHQTGQHSTYIGKSAGRSFTGSATDNTIIGSECHYNATSGSYNVSVGKQAMSLAGDASGCTAVGTDSLKKSSQGGSGGDNNTALGYEAGDELVSGSNCLILGRNAQASSTSVSNEITLGDANITKLRVPGINVVLKDNGGTPTEGHVLTVDASGEAGFAAASGGGQSNVGITTNLSGSFTASAGSPSTINTYGYGSGDIVVEYTIFIKNGSDFQTQKLLAMRDGTTIHSTQFAVMFSSSLLVQCDATINSGNILLRATPETGISGSTTYKVKREVM